MDYDKLLEKLEISIVQKNITMLYLEFLVNNCEDSTSYCARAIMKLMVLEEFLVHSK